MLLVIVLCASLAALAMPARHALLGFWPGSVVEVVYRDEAGEIRTGLFESLGSGRNDSKRLRSDDQGDQHGVVELARGNIQQVTRPRSVAVVGLADGGRVYGFPVGLRSSAEESGGVGLEPFAEDRSPVSVPAGTGDRALVIYGANGQRRDIPGEKWRFFYQPNRMTLSERASVLAHRILAEIRSGQAPTVNGESPDSVTEGNDPVD